MASSDQSIVVNGITITLDDVARFAPIVCGYETERFTPCTIDYLLHGASWVQVSSDSTGGPLWSDPGTPLSGTPTPDGIGALPDGGSAVKIEIHADQFTGQGWQAPMYVCPQAPVDAAYVDLNYIFLSPYNGPQSVQLDVPGMTIKCQVPSFAEHQGDVESITVRIDPTLTTVQHVRFEAHGDSIYSSPDQVKFDSTGKRPYVGCALNSHASYNLFGQSDKYTVPLMQENYGDIGIIIADFVDPHGPQWEPREYIFIGIEHGVPVNGQDWVKFGGRLGGYRRNSLGLILGADGILPPEIQALAQSIADGAVASSETPDANQHGIGTGGMADRPFIDVNNPVFVE